MPIAPADQPPLRIAMLTPPWFERPPHGFEAAEPVVAALTSGLAARGHEVTVVTLARAAGALGELEVDVVHDHTRTGPLLARRRREPTVVTMHGPVTGEIGDYFARLERTAHMVAVSETQRRLNPRLNWVGTVPLAVNVSAYPYREEKDDYVLWLGRFHPEAGAHLAIDAARLAGWRVVLAGRLDGPAERDYFETVIRPRLDHDAEYAGPADAGTRRELLAYARALVVPTLVDEPAGLAMVEAMACGTPVVALRRGSAPELVVEGVTGFIAEGFAGLVEALARTGRIDAATVRGHAEEHLDAAVMAAAYEEIYRRLVDDADGDRAGSGAGARVATGTAA